MIPFLAVKYPILSTNIVLSVGSTSVNNILLYLFNISKDTIPIALSNTLLLIVIPLR